MVRLEFLYIGAYRGTLGKVKRTSASHRSRLNRAKTLWRPWSRLFSPGSPRTVSNRFWTAPRVDIWCNGVPSTGRDGKVIKLTQNSSLFFSLSSLFRSCSCLQHLLPCGDGFSLEKASFCFFSFFFFASMLSFLAAMRRTNSGLEVAANSGLAVPVPFVLGSGTEADRPDVREQRARLLVRSLLI